MLTDQQIDEYASQVARLLRKSDPPNVIALWVTQRAFEEELSETAADAMNLALFSVPEIAVVLLEALSGAPKALLAGDLTAYGNELLNIANFYRVIAYKIGSLEEPLID